MTNEFDLTGPVLTLRGEPMIADHTGEGVMIADMIARAVTADDPQVEVTKVDKIRDRALAMKILLATGPVDLSAKEVVRIDDLCGKFLSKQVYPQIAEILGTDQV